MANSHEQGLQHHWHGGETQPRASGGQRGPARRGHDAGLVEALVCFSSIQNNTISNACSDMNRTN